MSAIFGIVDQHPQASKHDVISAMYQAMSHRGSDGSGSWQQAGVALGHGKFHTTVEAQKEQLPFHDKESRLVITADARIDNRDELSQQLALEPTISKDLPDSLFILKAYQKWGEQCVEHLLGDFSFAIWDLQNNSLFCARDHMGIKPFNYYQDSSSFIFASEVQGITAVPGFDFEHNQCRIADALLADELEGRDLTSTFFKDLRRLPPAHTLTLIDHKLSLHCYWRPDPEKRISLANDEEYIAAFTKIYTDAVKQRLRGGSVASMLSGGLDSSSIVGVARKIYSESTGQPLPVFSAISPDHEQCEETHFINSMLKQGGLNPHTISVDELSKINEEVSQIVNSAQEPFDPMIMIIALYIQAKKLDYRVMLDGLEGDMIFSLSESYPSILLKNGNYREALQEIRHLKNHYYAGHSSTVSILFQNLRSAFTPILLKRIVRQCRKGIKMIFKDKRTNLFNASFAKQVQISQRLTQASPSPKHELKGLPQAMASMHLATILNPSLTVAIERYDRVAAQCGIEARHPLLDKRLVEFMLALPWDQKVRMGWSKHLLRKASEPLLPAEVCWRKGWQHIGWTFEYKWLHTNFSEFTAVLNSMQRKMTTYVSVSFMSRLFTRIDKIKGNSYKELKDEDHDDLLEFYHLANWLKNRSSL